jgi:hypothetical protein
MCNRSLRWQTYKRGSGFDFVSLGNKKYFMSALEMKALAFEKLAALQDENAIQEVLNYLENISSNDKVKLSVLSHAIEIMKERSSVLEKLAQ